MLCLHDELLANLRDLQPRIEMPEELRLRALVPLDVQPVASEAAATAAAGGSMMRRRVGSASTSNAFICLVFLCIHMTVKEYLSKPRNAFP